ncbi:hypothetical protein EDC65_1092 [Stella humosa]|uniref:Uncharacterized protein n=1 Tax=Stella humosa TaxID=94 RepID=A0A3N1MFJ1_9PROT|nr:hypothetical protein [Stella humosa]ROQ01905.1 hypothetical protein EDC65_1092 [Stella humosa]BBK32294.1 hypothetical protein STHU_29280 [Stella humosa]
MKKTLLSATALAFALAAPAAFAAPSIQGHGQGVSGVMQTAQATTPQQSRPGTAEQGGQRSGDAGTAIPPTSTTGAPRTGTATMPMPSTMPGAVPGTDPTKANETGSGNRAGDSGSKELPTTPGSGAQPSAGTAMPGVTAPGQTQPTDAKPSESGQRVGDPGTAEPQNKPRPRT